MPEHTSFFSYLVSGLVSLLPEGSGLALFFGNSVLNHTSPTWRAWEPPLTIAMLVLLVLGLGWHVRATLQNLDEAIVPEEKLSVRTFFEVFLGYFYNLACEMMGPERAKRYFPIIGASACFVFFGNIVGILPGILTPPTSSLNITIGAALLVFILFNYYGIRTNGLGHFKHMCGPWLGPLGIPINILIFFVEFISTCVRPVTMSVRLMVNIAVDHMLGSLFLGLATVLVPVPVMALGLLVIFVQTLIFAMLTSVYIAFATEHEEHEASPAKQAHA